MRKNRIEKIADSDPYNQRRAREIFNSLLTQSKVRIDKEKFSIELVPSGWPMVASSPGGKNTLYMPVSFLDDNDDLVVKAVLAHELGHIIQMVHPLYKVMGICVLLVKIVTLFVLVTAIGFVPWWIILFTFFANNVVLRLLVTVPCRFIEKEADRYSVRLGYKNELVGFLEGLVSAGIKTDPVRYQPLDKRVLWIRSL
jgi:hypothetical protein